MPFIREGLCAADQVKCAKLLEAGVNPKAVAVKLRTSVKYVNKFTQEALDANAIEKKKAVVAMEAHAKKTRETASALAGAANTILSQGPNPDEFS